MRQDQVAIRTAMEREQNQLTAAHRQLESQEHTNPSSAGVIPCLDKRIGPSPSMLIPRSNQQEDAHSPVERPSTRNTCVADSLCKLRRRRHLWETSAHVNFAGTKTTRRPKSCALRITSEGNFLSLAQSNIMAACTSGRSAHTTASRTGILSVIATIVLQLGKIVQNGPRAGSFLSVAIMIC